MRSLGFLRECMYSALRRGHLDASRVTLGPVEFAVDFILGIKHDGSVGGSYCVTVFVTHMPRSSVQPDVFAQETAPVSDSDAAKLIVHNAC